MIYSLDTLKSYHIFTFPFQWEIGGEKLSFSEKHDLNKIKLPFDSLWLHVSSPESEKLKWELYNEKNFFYEFIHDVLYDNGHLNDTVRHYERKECSDTSDVEYLIKHKKSGKLFKLPVKSISLNLFATGVGTLSFYLENYNYGSFNEILIINQFGRRIYPPFLGTQTGVEDTKESELADYISIEGLNGDASNFFDDFTGYFNDSDFRKPAKFIRSLLDDFKNTCNMDPIPVVDDRMFVSCWIGDNEIAKKIKLDSSFWYNSDDWYKLIFVDTEYLTCQNDEMKQNFLKIHSLPRWQASGTLYGFSRYSLVSIMENSDYNKSVQLTIFRTIYFRIAELCLIQRASVLKFSHEVTHISTLADQDTSSISEQVSDLYKEYIRYINKVFFREITAQEQGIEIYDKLQGLMRIGDHVKSLDEEIEELHNYVAILEDRERNLQLKRLTILGALFIIPTFIISYYNMNEFHEINKNYGMCWLNIILIITTTITLMLFIRKKWIKFLLGALVFIIIIIAIIKGLPF